MSAAHSSAHSKKATPRPAQRCTRPHLSRCDAHEGPATAKGEPNTSRDRPFMSAGGTTLRLRAPHTVSSTSERASLTSGEEGGWVGRGHAACACACLPHRRRSPQQTTYTNGLRRARQGRGGRGRLRKGSGASRTDPSDREEVPTRKVVSNRGGVSAGVSLHRGAAAGGARAEGTAERRHSTAPLRLRRLPAESSRPAEL